MRLTKRTTCISAATSRIPIGIMELPPGPSLGERLKAFLMTHPVARELMANATYQEDDMHFRRNLAYSDRHHGVAARPEPRRAAEGVSHDASRRPGTDGQCDLPRGRHAFPPQPRVFRSASWSCRPARASASG